jgi:hypothetical protein
MSLIQTIRAPLEDQQRPPPGEQVPQFENLWFIQYIFWDLVLLSGTVHYKG